MKASIICVVLLVAIISSSVQSVKVNIGIYYESMCPGCRQQFLNNLTPARRAIGEYLNIDLVPFGNAHVYSNSVTCQHGQEECYGNAVHACALSLYDFDTAFRYIGCMFQSGSPSSAASRCASSAGVNFQQIQSCATGSQGMSLIRRMAQKTQSLSPSKQYVPWDTINGQHVENVDFTRYICQNYLRNENAPGCRNFL